MGNKIEPLSGGWRASDGDRGREESNGRRFALGSPGTSFASVRKAGQGILDCRSRKPPSATDTFVPWNEPPTSRFESTLSRIGFKETADNLAAIRERFFRRNSRTRKPERCSWWCAIAPGIISRSRGSADRQLPAHGPLDWIRWLMQDRSTSSPWRLVGSSELGGVVLC